MVHRPGDGRYRLRRSAHSPANGAATRHLAPAFLDPDAMNVIALTILVSSCLAGIFIFCFAGEFRRSRRSSPDRDSLLPLDDDTPLSK